jgi:pimeloyl-ACP methyl ester carboxylesterase
MKKILLIALAIFLLLVIGLLAVPFGYLSNDRSFKEVSIPGEGYQIHAYLSEGKDPSGKWVIFVHGNRKPGQDHELYQSIRESLPAEYSVLAVDLRGFGGSVGSGENQFPASIDRAADLAAVSDYLFENYGVDQDRIILIGHSYGAAQVLNVAQEDDYLLAIPVGLGDWDALLKS